MKRIWGVLWGVLLSCIASALTLEGTVVKVSDGDTITVLDGQRQQHKIRLNGIDAPESHQAFGRVSRRALAEMIATRAVRVDYQKTDVYGRILGDVFFEGKNINLEMVKAGMAWHYVHFAKDHLELAHAEAEARAQKRGLWIEPHPIPPWDFRRLQKQNGKETK